MGCDGTQTFTVAREDRLIGRLQAMLSENADFDADLVDESRNRPSVGNAMHQVLCVRRPKAFAM